MKTVTARQANQQFSRLLSEVVAGEEVVITHRGRPVATIIPYGSRQATEQVLPPGPPPMTPERKAAIERMLEWMQKGWHLGGIRATRDEMHER
jgi:prevent-host-death family protein